MRLGTEQYFLFSGNLKLKSVCPWKNGTSFLSSWYVELGGDCPISRSNFDESGAISDPSGMPFLSRRSGKRDDRLRRALDAYDVCGQADAGTWAHAGDRPGQPGFS